ncbi:MAG: F0F1 ATP synthase subunit alpha, partial [Patescibacteria group bacterium]
MKDVKTNQTKDTLLKTLEEELKNFESSVTVEKVGTVLEVGDGIAKVAGLSDCMAAEMLDFGNGVMGVALNLEADQVGVMILGDYLSVEQGDTVKSTGKILSLPVGPAMVGRVVNP